jgi:hypothetical protein
MAVYKAKAIIPKTTLSSANADKAIKRAREKTARKAVSAFEHTTRRWKTPVTFSITNDGDTTYVGTNSDVFLYNDQPTKKHKIRARRRKYLVFYSRNRWNYLKEVNHPGTKGKYIARKVAAAMAGEFHRAMRIEMEGLAG